MPKANNKAGTPSAQKSKPANAAKLSSPLGSPPAPVVASSAAAERPAAVLKPTVYDPAAAEAVLAVLYPRLRAIPAGALSIPRVDVHAAALAALGVHAYVTGHAPLRTRFERLSVAGEFEIATLEGLKEAAFVVLLAHWRAREAGVFATDVKVPAPLVEEAMAVERRMQELTEYRFKRDPEIAPLLAMLRPGSGYRDLEADMLGYASIYEKRPAEVAADATNYRTTDAADARRLAGEILAHLAAAMTPRGREAYELLQRSWTWLVQVHFEVSEAGRWLLRYDPESAARFPSLFAAGRPGGGRPPRKPKAKGEEGPPPEK